MMLEPEINELKTEKNPDSSESISASDKPFQSIWRWQTLVSLAVTALVLALLATQIDTEQLLRDLAACDKSTVLMGLLAHYATYPIRGLRWQRTLGDLPQVKGAGRFGLIVLFYNAVDNVLPAKFGDLYAAHLARLNLQVRRSSALGSIVFQRLVDAWVVFFMAGVCSWIVFADHLPGSLAWVLGGGLLLALIITVAGMSMLLLRNHSPSWIPEGLAEMIEAFHGGFWPAKKDRVPIAGLTATIWTLECLWIFCLMAAFDITLSPPELIFLTAVPLLASAFPLTPSGAGAVEITLYGSLRLLNVSSPLAVSITVLNRLIDFWLHIGLGILIWGFRHQLGLHTLRERTALTPKLV
jgi:uncharacterized protein (TIRG00374 family)